MPKFIVNACFNPYETPSFVTHEIEAADEEEAVESFRQKEATNLNFRQQQNVADGRQAYWIEVLPG